METRKLGVGIVGGGYMGKAHSVAMHAVGAVFDTALRPALEMVCTTTPEGAARKASELGFSNATSDWRELVNNPAVEAIVIASPQETHLEISSAAFELGKPVFCEKPLGRNLADSRAMTAAAKASNCINMVGFNYIRTPASQLAREIIGSGEIGDVTYIRGEHTEDFFADPESPATWRTEGRSNGTMGDLAPHIINASQALGGPMERVLAEIETVVKERPGKAGMQKVTNDDHAQIMCRFTSGALGAFYVSRTAFGRKMGYAYDIFGTKGSIRFDQEDQNALWLYEGGQNPSREGFKKVLTGPHHPDYVNFCLGAGHGTGYQDQIIIEARDFLKAIETGTNIWPTFEDGLYVNQVVEASWQSNESRSWINLDQV
ncbi:Gfo/Idh/MocA family oxidoreductase [Roseibium porphyridii]|uniref:Gfo/Idh/MocA family oxidoreductase n=1 Tax=Roseibium porphyridii TaxID=2866279 RepID=A0ABY8FCR2_9HYPH|nr:Gfo/Idh/MocA family oxidoreductase [Roseibium sp. KMA01]WFE91055.1 Gfo/Idh/MocA family oxidoreductase [Roseibium sp. KMA01]